LIVLLLIGLTLSLGPVTLARASSSIIVNNQADNKIASDGFCTLREAIIAANKDKASGGKPGECPAGSGADTIVLPAGVYTLSRTDNGKEDAAATGDLDITGNLTIAGAGADVTMIDADDISDRVFHVLSGNVTISGVMIKNGHVSGNGGGVYNMGSLTLTNTTVATNEASGAGGGIYNAASGTMTISLSTMADNAAGGNGGGLINAGGSATMVNSTISGNRSDGDGGGLFSSGATSVSSVTITQNTADHDYTGTGDGGGVHVSAGSLTIGNSILAENRDISLSIQHHDCSGALNSQGHNLLQETAGCSIGGDLMGNITGQPPLLGPLASNGGTTQTHALQLESPAVEAGDNTACPATDQRGLTRPQGHSCDMGAFEFENPPQIGPTLIVNTANDIDDGTCGFDHCSLREAITLANDSLVSNTILFDIAGDLPTIALQSALPAVTDPVVIDGSTQPGGAVALAPDEVFTGTDGLAISAGDSAIRGLYIIHFNGHGILLDDQGNNVIEGNTIAFNDGDGIRLLAGSGNTITGNNIHDNGGLSIDLGGDGRTLNDLNDGDSGANLLQNYPVLFRAIPGANSLATTGRLNSASQTSYTIEFFASESCNLLGGGEQTFLGSTQATTDATGSVYFQASDLPAVPTNHFINATATDPQGNTSEFSDCVAVGPGNDSWPNAMTLAVADNLTPTAVEQYLDLPGQSRWYKFAVEPGSKIIVTLTDLPANYDLTIYKDIEAAFVALNSPQDLLHLGAEFAPEAFSPEAFSPEAFSPEAFSPEAFSPEAFSPEAFSPEAFSPEAFSPEAFSPEAFSPEAFSPDAFSPEAFSPEAFSPEAFSPEAFSPEAFSPEAFSSAQSRSLLGVSAFQGTAGEGLIVNTWNNQGNFYVRVRGANGAFSPEAPFHLEVAALSGTCSDVEPIATAGTITPVGDNYKTIILTDLARMAGTPEEKATLEARLATFAAQPEVAGVVVDVGVDARVAAANAQADDQPACPHAKNLVAGTIKEIVDAYWALNPLAYVVIVGNDGVIPFFRYPDSALLANENNYVPPVRDSSTSQANLRLGFVLSQDAYGAQIDVALKNTSLPIPELAVGRLVETAVEATNMLDAYLATGNGVVSPTTPPLVTGYDFLEDVALAVKSELEAGTAEVADTLIAARDLSPADPAAWTADDLRAALLGSRHDLVFLAGHFSASGALAADYSSRMIAEELITSPVDLQNAVIFSAGCHSGYNIVDADGVPLVTEEPDWAQALAQKGATLIAGTGYQYGDTDFIEYSERLYLEFSRQLRTGSGPVSIGQALVAAKQVYLADTVQLRGIHEKAFLEATLFGLPMLSLDMPGARLAPEDDASIVSATTPVETSPGADLGLAYADVTIAPLLSDHTVSLTNVDDPETAVTAFYLSGGDGIVTNPAEPTLPLEVANVGVSDTVLRGVGFRGGSYTDLLAVLPFSGAPTTEIRGVHAPFLSTIFYPVQPWRVNYFAALADPAGEGTRLMVTPAQFRSTEPGAQTGVMRQFNEMDFRLYYSGNLATFANNSVPALAAPPTIVRVSAVPGDGHVNFSLDVVSNPAAGVQEVWVTYTALAGPWAGFWQSLDLSQSASNSAQWQGTLALAGTNPADLRYVAQAVNGVGLVSLATNLGAYYVPGAAAPTPEPTELSLAVPAATGPYGSQVSVSAVLTTQGVPLAGQPVTFGLGPQSRQAITDNDGQATVTLTLLGLPGHYNVRAAFAGTAEFQATSATDTFEITKQDTVLTLEQPASGFPGDNALITATLTDATGRRLGEKTVFFVLTGSGGSASKAVITDFAGRAVLGGVDLPHGSYTVKAYFSGTILLHTGTILILDDARYNPTMAMGTLELLNRAPVAVQDFYSMDQGAVLNVTPPGVLANDSDADDDMLVVTLVSGPGHGDLALNADGSFTYTPTPSFFGTDSFTYVANDGNLDSNEATVTITVNSVNSAPECSSFSTSVVSIWPLNKQFTPVQVLGITDPDGDLVTIAITRIFQDEPVGQGSNSPDGRGVGTDTAEVRAERDGNGNGRVYHIFFTATDGRGGSCSGEARLPTVPHDQSGDVDAIDEGPLYDSTVPG
jgi:CSLREA domain-containing protein